MRKLKMMLCVMMLPLVVVGCTSKQSVRPCVKPPSPPAWAMMPPSNSLQLLDETFSVSGTELSATKQH
ncbi:Rz1 family lipoprotein [Escherichia coli]